MIASVVEGICIIAGAGPGGTEADRPPRQRILEIDRKHGGGDRQRDERLKAEPTAEGSPQRLDSATRKGERGAHRRRTTQINTFGKLFSIRSTPTQRLFACE